MENCSVRQTDGQLRRRRPSTGVLNYDSMRTTNRISLSLVMIGLPVVATWLLFDWDSPIATALIWVVAGFIGWAFSKTLQPKPWRRRAMRRLKRSS